MGRGAEESDRATAGHYNRPVIRQRLSERLRAGGDASDARPEIYEAQVQVFELVTELPPYHHLSLHCGRPLGSCVVEARRLVNKRLAPPPA